MFMKRRAQLGPEAGREYGRQVNGDKNRPLLQDFGNSDTARAPGADPPSIPWST